MNLPEKAEKSLDMVIKRFKSGELPKAMAQTAIEGNRPLDSWSFRNKVIAFAHNTMDARGYKQWQKVGRQVKKGASAFYIFGPIIKTVEEEKENEDGETTVEEKEKLVGFRTIPVFRKEDTEGEPLNTDYGPDQLPPLKAVLDALGYDVGYAPKTTMARGSTDPKLKRIELKGGSMTPRQARKIARSLRFRRRLWRDIPKMESRLRSFIRENVQDYQGGPVTVALGQFKVTLEDGDLDIEFMKNKIPDGQKKFDFYQAEQAETDKKVAV